MNGDQNPMTGRRVSLNEVFARREAEIAAQAEAQNAWEKTPEGAEWRRKQDEHHARMAAADERYAAEHPAEEDDEGENGEEGEDGDVDEE